MTALLSRQSNPSGSFLTPGAGPRQSWALDTTQNITYSTVFSSYTIALWQQFSSGGGANLGPILLGTLPIFPTSSSGTDLWQPSRTRPPRRPRFSGPSSCMALTSPSPTSFSFGSSTAPMPPPRGKCRRRACRRRTLPSRRPIRPPRPRQKLPSPQRGPRIVGGGGDTLDDGRRVGGRDRRRGWRWSQCGGRGRGRRARRASPGRAGGPGGVVVVLEEDGRLGRAQEEDRVRERQSGRDGFRPAGPGHEQDVHVSCWVRAPDESRRRAQRRASRSGDGGHKHWRARDNC